ncbi:MAG: hypothetical protein ACRD1K_06785 [Acidimicrobiales bacterium]
MAERDEVRLALPADPQFVQLARVTASGMASRLGFTYDEVEDLRLALDELCFVLIGSTGRPGTVDIRYVLVDGALVIEGVGRFDGDYSHQALSPFSEQILPALVDEFEIYRDDGGRPGFRLRKRRTRT